MEAGSSGGQTPGAGWHPDPHGKAALRYWDGTRWTEHVSGDPDVAQATTTPRSPTTGEPDGGGNGWLNRNWPWIVAAVAGLIVGAAAGAGGNGSQTTTVANTVTETQTETETETERKVKTVHEASPAATSAPSSDAGSGGSYSGNGEKNLGTIEVPTESVLRWQHSGGFFAIHNDFNDADTIDVTSQGHNGETTVAAGTYHKVDVLADGEWSFSLSPK